MAPVFSFVTVRNPGTSRGKGIATGFITYRPELEAELVERLGQHRDRSSARAKRALAAFPRQRCADQRFRLCHQDQPDFQRRPRVRGMNYAESVEWTEDRRGDSGRRNVGELRPAAAQLG